MSDEIIEEEQSEEISEDEPETFDKAYVDKLKSESAGNRIKAKKATEYATRLHTEIVRATGRLADPSDLEFSEEHLEDADKLNASIDALLEAKPHLKAPKKIDGDIGQGKRKVDVGPTDFSQLFAR